MRGRSNSQVSVVCLFNREDAIPASRSRLRGIVKSQALAHVVGAAYNLLRIERLVQ